MKKKSMSLLALCLAASMIFAGTAFASDPEAIKEPMAEKKEIEEEEKVAEEEKKATEAEEKREELIEEEGKKVDAVWEEPEELPAAQTSATDITDGTSNETVNEATAEVVTEASVETTVEYTSEPVQESPAEAAVEAEIGVEEEPVIIESGEITYDDEEWPIEAFEGLTYVITGIQDYEFAAGAGHKYDIHHGVTINSGEVVSSVLFDTSGVDFTTPGTYEITYYVYFHRVMFAGWLDLYDIDHADYPGVDSSADRIKVTVTATVTVTEDGSVVDDEKPMSPEAYEEIAMVFGYDIINLDVTIASVGSYIENDVYSGLSQEELQANGLKYLEENDGITEDDIVEQVNVIYSLRDYLVNVPDGCQELYNDVVYPLMDTFVNLYNLVWFGSASFDSGDDYVNAYSEALNASEDAMIAWSNYFTNDEETNVVAEGEPVVYDLMNGLGTDVIGAYSILEIPESEATIDYLTKWYRDYVIPSGHNWDIIVYSDRDDGVGVWANSASMNANIYLTPSESGGYTQGGNTSTTVYYNLKDGELVAYFDAADYGAAQGKTAEEVLEDYAASGDAYPARWDFIYQLEYEGYSTEEAEAAVAASDIDWNELAAEDLETWYSIREDVESAVDELRSDGFTDDEIQYALDKLGLN